MTYGEALAQITEALAQEGFMPLSWNELTSFGGEVRAGSRNVGIVLSFPCVRFTRLPIARLTRRSEDLPGVVAHIEEEDRLCYAAPGSLVLDMHEPGCNALTVLKRIE